MRNAAASKTGGVTGAEITREDVAYAKAVAFAFARRLPGMDYEEAESIAMLALCETARRWRSDRGASLRTLVFLRIRGALIDAHISVPGHSKSRALSKRCQHVDIAQAYSLGRQATQETTAELSEVLRAICSMAPRDQALLLRAIDGETLREVGARHGGLTKAWMSRQEDAARDRLRERLEGRAA